MIHNNITQNTTELHKGGEVLKFSIRLVYVNSVLLYNEIKEDPLLMQLLLVTTADV